MKPHRASWASITFLLLLLYAAPAAAQVPLQINFQGMLTDDTGLPVPDDSYAMTFAIYDVASGGTALWSETRTVSLSGGVYNVVLGQPGNEIDPVDMDGERFLGVTVGSDDEMTPRQPITATGFSLRSALSDDADTLDGFEAIDFAASTHAHSAAEITSGTLSTGYYSAVSDLGAEGYLGNAAGDLAQNNGTRQVNLNADLLDGLSSSAFMSSTTDNWVNVSGDTMTGVLSVPSLQIDGTRVFSADEVYGTTFVGLEAGNSGFQNTCVGFRAGTVTEYGSLANSFIGDGAGFRTTVGKYNTFLGSGAGAGNTEGNHNTCIGSSAGYTNTTGSGSVFLGYRVGYYETSANKLYIDNSDTSEPLIWGDFSTDVAAINGRLGVGAQPGSAYQFHSLDERTGGRAVFGEATGANAIGVWGNAVGDNSTGLWGRGRLAGGYFLDDNDSGLAYVGYGNRGIWAKGTMAGGTFSHPDNTTFWADVSTSTRKIQGTGTVSFVQNHPYDENTVIVYAAPEGDEVAVYTRGTARLVGGEARVTIGETFQYVANPDVGLTAHLTPRGDSPVPLSVASLTTSEMIVYGPTGSNAAFDYLVYGLRLGFEEAAVLQPKQRDALLPTAEAIEEGYGDRPDLRAFNALARYREMHADVSPGAELDLGHSRELVSALEDQRSAALIREAARQEGMPGNSESTDGGNPRTAANEPIAQAGTEKNTKGSLPVQALIAELRAEIDVLKDEIAAIKSVK